MLRLVVLIVAVGMVWGHGRLIDPPGRSTMWRYGFDNPSNYNDNELFCGGYGRQHARNGGKCGICGDAWDLKEPRPNEDGGLYGNGIVVRKYKPGELVTFKVDLTANHWGHFEFKLCPVTSPDQKTDQDCLDKHPILLADGSTDKYPLPHGGKAVFDVNVKIPDNIQCKRCVLQWHYRTANRWGKCPNGSGRNGCGPQETFRACADVSILP